MILDRDRFAVAHKTVGSHRCYPFFAVIQDGDRSRTIRFQVEALHQNHPGTAVPAADIEALLDRALKGRGSMSASTRLDVRVCVLPADLRPGA